MHGNFSATSAHAFSSIHFEFFLVAMESDLEDEMRFIWCDTRAPLAPNEGGANPDARLDIVRMWMDTPASQDGRKYVYLRQDATGAVTSSYQNMVRCPDDPHCILAIEYVDRSSLCASELYANVSKHAVYLLRTWVDGGGFVCRSDWPVEGDQSEVVRKLEYMIKETLEAQRFAYRPCLKCHKLFLKKDVEICWYPDTLCKSCKQGPPTIHYEMGKWEWWDDLAAFEEAKQR
jgi:hypothetical protein